MTASEIKKLLTDVDPDAQRYEHDGAGTADAYTVWRELRPVGLYGDGREEGSIRFQVDRFTKEEDEALAAQLLSTLEGCDDIAVDYLVDYERDTGYIHHIYVCEAV
jgi:hypothetical protein